MFLFKIQGYFFQLIATLIGCLLTFSYGILLGISPSQTLDYQSEKTALNRLIDKNDAHWITLYLFLGAIIGSAISGFGATKYGRKPILLCCGISQITSWFCLAFGYDVLHVYISRLFAGLSIGGAFTVLPVYISEISEAKSRGSLGSYIVLFENLGIIFGLIIVKQIHYDYVSLIGLGFSSAFTLSFPFVQESPYFYLIKGDVTLEKSLRWFRAIRSIEQRQKPEFLDEVDKFKDLKENSKISATTNCSKRMIKIYSLGLIFAMVIQFYGYLTFLNQSKNIFEETGDLLYFKNYWMNIILACVQAVGSFVAVLIADRINRKILISISCLGTFLILFMLGGIMFLEKNNNTIITGELMKWISVVCLWGSVFLPNIALYPLSFVIMTEIFPYEKKGFLMTIFMTYQWLFTFLSELYFDFIVSKLAIFGLFWALSLFYLFKLVEILLVMPETRRKSFDEIQKIL